jgi:hypothetical protein
MFRHALFAVACVIALPDVPAHAQPSICTDADLVFIGRAEAPVTFRVSGEAAIETARQNLIRTEADIARIQASLDERTRLERSAEFAIRLIKAQEELSMRRAMYPPPYEVTFIPLTVVRPFRGVSEATLMLHARPHLPLMQPNEEYLVYGRRSTNLIPPFPEMGDLATLADYVEAESVIRAASAQQHLQFLESTVSGATVMGTLRMHSYGDGLGAPLGGVRVLVSSETQVVEATTAEDGSFVASGLRDGQFDITPALAADLTIVNQKEQAVTVRDSGCAIVELRAGINGRVRGRIFSDSRVSFETVTLNLSTMRADRRSMGSHDPRITTNARADGSFELSGVPPGTYMLVAWVEKTDGGKARTVATYYPGTDDLDAAIPIVVGKATVHDGFDFVVKIE